MRNVLVLTTVIAFGVAAVLVWNPGIRKSDASLEPVSHSRPKVGPETGPQIKRALQPRMEPRPKGGRDPQGFEPNPHQDVRTALREMLIAEQIKYLRQPLDGGAYQARRVRFFPGSVEELASEPLYNPNKVALTKAQTSELKKLAEKWNRKLLPGDSKIGDVQKEYARNHGTVPSEKRNGHIVLSKPPHFLATMVNYSGPDLNGTFRFEHGMIPERDALLAEQTLLLIDAEFEVIAFFQGLFPAHSKSDK